ncbi:hypothetical protein BO83DRAFT_379628 [Aspergillus eucalypticola CBS 122712]|uniref:Ribosomal protein S21 n=1 Tax=Aspergillus eucalypticola (strain CBS 122712 / IBT 29274) TaxID=1448314 RepID=A0A317VDR0_ASPEC|nr:uncharacterized protein BO83DRAFT_379628 [Aspergillus eucalypticola CBS 122712]PWY70020.1 hypothetical protein BO83DRAFT_379628 [Aspergillus eucalypticola CBS 122712]
MDMRALSRSLLRAKPTTTLYKSQQQQQQLLPARIGLRFSSESSSSSSSSSPSNKNTTTTQPPTRQTQQPSSFPSTSQKPTDFDQILNKLNFNNTNTTTTPTPGSNAAATPGSTTRAFNDSLSLSRAVGLSAETDGLRTATSLRKIDLKLGPTLGRQVTVEPERGMDLPAALRSLSTVIGQNKMKQSLMKQKYHVRKGMVRKQLRMQRWRKLFKFSFQATVKRIQKIRGQGW